MARAGALGLFGTIASNALNFLLIVVVTRGLHPARRAGVLFEVVALFTILTNTAELGADTGLVRMISRYRALGRTRDLRRTIGAALWPVLALAALLGLAVFVFARPLADVFIREGNRTAATEYIRLFAPFIPLATATAVMISASRGFGTMVPFVVVQGFGVPGLRPALFVAALVAGLGTTAYALSWTLPVAAGFLAALIVLMRLLRRAERREPAREPARSLRRLAGEFWRFSAPRGLAGVFQTAVIWLDILLVGALRNSREAGIYAAVSRLVGIGAIALPAIGLAIAPQISALLARDERRRAEAVFQTATWWLMALSLPVYLVLATFAPFILRLFGREYVAGQTALVILSLALLTFIGTGNNKIVLLMSGGSAWNLGITAVSLGLNIGLNLVLIPRLGMNGAAWAFAASIVFDNLATTLVVWLRLKVDPFGAGYLVVALGAAACYGGLGILVRHAFGMRLSTLVAYGAAATAAYALLLWRARNVLRLRVLRSALRSRARGDGDGAESLSIG